MSFSFPRKRHALVEIMIFKSLCRHAGIGANSYLLETSSSRIVLDAGMHPKHEALEAIPHYDFLEENGQQGELHSGAGSAVFRRTFSCGADFDDKPMKDETVVEAGGDQ